MSKGKVRTGIRARYIDRFT